MRVGNEDVIDLGQLGDGQIADACTGIDQNVVVDQKRRGAQMSPADATAATENAYLHFIAACVGPPRADVSSTSANHASG
jgi:hypothetical protein